MRSAMAWGGMRYLGAVVSGSRAAAGTTTAGDNKTDTMEMHMLLLVIERADRFIARIS